MFRKALKKKSSKEVLAVAKFYGFEPGGASRVGVVALVGKLTTQLPSGAYEFTVNYRNARAYSPAAFEGAVSTLTHVEQLLVVAPDGSRGISLTALLAQKLPRRLFELCVFWRTEEDSPRFREKVSVALEYLDVVYGYGRALAPDYAALSEARPKRTWLGISFEGDEREHQWINGPTLSGSIKGIYPFNVLSTPALQLPLVAPLMSSLPPEKRNAIGHGLTEVVLGEDDLARLRVDFPSLNSYVRS